MEVFCIDSKKDATYSGQMKVLTAKLKQNSKQNFDQNVVGNI